MIYWIWLTQIEGIGPVSQQLLLGKFQVPENIYRATMEELTGCKGIGKDKAGRILKARSLEQAKRILEKTEQLNIKLLTRNDLHYPEKAKMITDMPALLYYRGTIIEDSMGVAIVGSRRCTDYGKRIVTEASAFLARNGISVISGMAKGIDAYAHTVCLKEGGYTIAFLGNGPDICYPSEHQNLMERILENGAVISEYPPNTPPDKSYFPRRNRLISAWSHKVLVIEAGLNSGSLITAEFAEKLGREVLAVPDNIFSRESMGSNVLIQKSAKIYLGEAQLLIQTDRTNEKPPVEQVQKNPERKRNEPENMSATEALIINAIKSSEPKSIQELSINLSMNQMRILESVSVMELKGWVKCSQGLVQRR